MRIAVIPARGKSKRIPRKNVLRFGGKPMLVWTIEAAIYSSLFDKIIVSTDDWEIAGIAEEAGADVPFTRDESLADDITPASDVTVDVVKRIGGDEVCQLLPSCPFRTSSDITNAYNHFKRSSAPSQISITDFGWQCPAWAMDRNSYHLHPEMMDSRSQDLQEMYHPSGACWWANSTMLLLNKTFYMSGRTGWYLPWRRAFDIDTPDDLELAKTLLRGVM